MNRPRASLTAALLAAPILLVLLGPSQAQAQEEVWRGGGANRATATAPSPPPPAPDPPEPPPPGQAALDRARAAWEKGDFDVAEPLYAEALDRGGLAPLDVLDAYVHLGAARSVLSKKAAALVAFKSAALLDVHFIVPPEAGKKAIALADRARQATKTGSLVFDAQIPDHIAAQTAMPIDVTLDSAHATALPGSTIAIYARRRAGDPLYEESFRTAATTHFDLPGKLSLPSTTLRVRVDWLDTHANRLASRDERVHVQPLPNTAALSPLPLAAEGEAAHQPDTAKRGGFWHSPWPYILGTLALAGGGVAIYFATRTPSDVNITGTHVMAQ